MFGRREQKKHAETHNRDRDLTDVEVLRQQVSELQGRLLTVESELAHPRLQKLLAEYKKYGGEREFDIQGTQLVERLTNYASSGYALLPRAYGGYNASLFQHNVLIPQKAKWAEEHTCRAARKGGRK